MSKYFLITYLQFMKNTLVPSLYEKNTLNIILDSFYLHYTYWRQFFLLLNQTLHITAHKMSLICHASLTDSVYRSIHGYNDQQLLLPKTRYNKLHTSEHTRLQWPTITPCYNSIQQTPHHWTSLYFYSTMEYLHTVKLYWKKRILENNALPECCALTA